MLPNSRARCMGGPRAGKTHTLVGVPSHDVGLLPRALIAIFHHLQAARSHAAAASFASTVAASSAAASTAAAVSPRPQSVSISYALVDHARDTVHDALHAAAIGVAKWWRWPQLDAGSGTGRRLRVFALDEGGRGGHCVSHFTSLVVFCLGCNRHCRLATQNLCRRRSATHSRAFRSPRPTKRCDCSCRRTMPFTCGRRYRHKHNRNRLLPLPCHPLPRFVRH